MYNQQIPDHQQQYYEVHQFLEHNNFSKWKIHNLSEVSPNYVTDFKLGEV